MSGDRDKLEADPRDALLAAYVDGVAELARGERRHLDARLAEDPAARAEAAAVREVLDRLRAIPPEGTEPDWAALERSIRTAVGERAPSPWWRRARWLVPGATLAAAAAALVLTWRAPGPRDLPPTPGTAPAVAVVADERAGDDPVRLWLDGAEVDVDPVLGMLLVDDSDAAGDEVGLLPSVDLAWVDGLDDESLDHAERWLAGKKG